MTKEETNKIRKGTVLKWKNRNFGTHYYVVIEPIGISDLEWFQATTYKMSDKRIALCDFRLDLTEIISY